MVYAGFWRRFCAYVIDYVIVVIMLYVLVVPMGVVFGLSAGMAKDREQHSQHSALSVVEKIIPLAENSAVERMDTPAIADQPAMPAMPPVTAAPEAPISEAPAAPVQSSAQPNLNMDQPQEEPAEKLDPMMALLVGILYVVCFAASMAYHTCFIASKWQATPGKRVMNCIVVTRDGKRLSYGHALGRHLACFLSWLPFPPVTIGFFLAGWTREKTALHDMISGSRVVKVELQPVVLGA